MAGPVSIILIGTILIPTYTFISIKLLKMKHRLRKIKNQGYRKMKKHKYMNGMFVEEREDECSYEFATKVELIEARNKLLEKCAKFL